MTNYPPNFISELERKSWNEGFVAGVKEALHELESSANDEDLDAPTREWVQEFSVRVSNKYV